MNTYEHRLTSKQARLLRFLYEFRESNGDGPTMLMMVKNLNLASNRSAIDMLRLLVANGYLKPNPKISRSTILTSKALLEINVIPQPKFQPQQVNMNKSPHQLQWNNVPQPTGSQSSGLAHEITKLLGNALSTITYNTTGTSSRDKKESLQLNPLVFMVAASIIIYLMFGTGVQAAILVTILIMITSIRSIK